MKKAFFKIVCFIFIIGGVIRYTDKVLSVKYLDGIRNFQKFYEMGNNTIDVLVIGSSHAHHDVNTGTLWEEYGIASFVLGSQSQPMWNTYYFFKEALKTQTPQLLIIEAYETIERSEYGDDSRIIKGTYGMKWSKNRIDAIRASVPDEKLIEFMLSYIQYHTRYTEVYKEDFLFHDESTWYPNQGQNFYENWKGMFFNMKTESFKTPDIVNVTERSKMSEKTERYYRKTIELAIENNIPILVIISPYACITENDEKIFNTAGDIAKEYGVEFINYNLLYDKIGIDFAQDVADSHHLNYRGNRKYTHEIGDFISKKYNISDRRGDEKYESWEANVKHIDGLIKNQEVLESESLTDLIENIKKYDFKIIISVDGKCNTSDTNITSLMDAFDIPKDNQNGIWYISCKNGILASSGMGETKKYYSFDRHDICMSRIFNEETQSYINSVVIDNVTYKKVNNGVNITVYNPTTQNVVTSVGFDMDNGYQMVK